MFARPSIRPITSVRVLLVVLVTALVGTLYRVAGADSPDPQAAEVAYIATGTNFPDALGAGPAAALGNGPILLVQTDSVPSQTTTELNRLKPRLIVIVGGTAVVSTTVENTLKGLSFGPTVIRVSGSNRYATAAAISESAFPCADGDVMAGRDRTGVVCRPALSGMWNTQKVVETGFVGYDTSLAIDAFGNPAISYYDGTTTDLMLVRCSDPACAGSKTITTVDPNLSNGRYSSLVLDSSGFPVISYHDASSGFLKLARCSNLTCTAKTLTTVDASFSVGSHTSLALDSSGLPVISYHDADGMDLKLARCSNATCSSATLVSVDSGSAEVGWFTSLVLDSSGFPVISYYDMTNTALKLARCSDATCTARTLTTVDSSGDVGFESSVALDTSGFPVISYHDGTNGDLKLARCTNSACTTNTLTVVDSTGTVGRMSSLVLDRSRFPVISYYDGSNEDLKVARCSNATCSSATITTVDSAGTVGFYTSLALDPAGNPVISYQDFSSVDLKLASF
ncbi:MAG: cell wall-binding repeat-containing protein [Acidimicrobiia bacterium]|nr:MAG: cell wall-binding repeat-containing protein [Acidimicrobiia bacterium]